MTEGVNSNFYLADFSYEQLKDRIDSFNGCDFKKLKPAEIHRKVANLFALDADGGKQKIPRTLIQLMLPENSMFYRARKLKCEDDYASEQDFCWNPEPPLGRLNPKRSPLLYACCPPNPIVTAISEA